MHRRVAVQVCQDGGGGCGRIAQGLLGFARPVHRLSVDGGALRDVDKRPGRCGVDGFVEVKLEQAQHVAQVDGAIAVKVGSDVLEVAVVRLGQGLAQVDLQGAQYVGEGDAGLLGVCCQRRVEQSLAIVHAIGILEALCAESAV